MVKLLTSRRKSVEFKSPEILSAMLRAAAIELIWH